MKRIDAMLSRLPQLYRDGELLRDVLELAATQIEIIEEEALEVQRAHWFDTLLNLDEAAALAAPLDIPPESWQRLGEYRAWVHSLRDAILQEGSVTRRALQQFIQEYSGRYQAASGIAAIWPASSPAPGDLTFIENPPRRKYDRAPAVGGIEPLHHFSVTQKGLDETPAGFLLVGLPTAPESAPVIANLTSGQALVFLGNVHTGERLWLRPDRAGVVQATLEGKDVSDRLVSIGKIQPGTAWTPADVQRPARALTLKRGKNDLWFLPVAHFDVLGLDRFLLGLADLLLSQGRYDATNFDQALFYQDPAVLLRMTWVETEPASFEVRLPAGALLSSPEELDGALEARDHLEFSMNLAVARLKAAGVASQVLLAPFRETQGQLDLLTQVLPLTQREIGSTGADRMPDAGGVFEVTEFEQSIFR